jgi:ABC-type sugar transport system ATPase subunit
MVGREIAQLFPAEKKDRGETVLEVERLSNEMFQNISFSAHRGEVLGFAGLMGAGRTEIMETLFGLVPYKEGSIKINGKAIKIDSPVDAIGHGMALISEDRKLKGLNLKGSVKTNLTLSCLSLFSNYLGVVKTEKENKFADREIKKFSIKARSRHQTVNTLSGGNQQKVVLSKWLATGPQIIIFDEPTRGIDVGAKAEIYALIRELAKEGKTILLVSSEMPEIIGLCDRVIVLHEGSITRELQQRELNQETIMEAAMGSSKE